MHLKNCLSTLAAAASLAITQASAAPAQPDEQPAKGASSQTAHQMAQQRSAMTREERISQRRKVIIDAPKKDKGKPEPKLKPKTNQDDPDDAAQAVENARPVRLPETLAPAARMSAETKKAIEARGGKAPSQAFKNFFTPWAVKLGHMRLLHNSVSDLLRQYPQCQVIQTAGSSLNPVVACANPRAFGAEGEVVIFEYLPSNDALSGAEYFFSNERKARAFATLIVREIRSRVDTFRDAASTWGYDSPLFRVQVFPAGEGALVKVKAHQTDALNAFDVYGRARIRQIDFGKLVIGATKLTEIPQPNDECDKLTGNMDQLNQEFYGRCFGFPRTAHYQLSFDGVMNTLKTVVLTPLQGQTSDIVEAALIRKYGNPKQCKKVISSVRIARLGAKRMNEPHPASTMDRIRQEPATVYLGECSDPIIFTTGPRYVFVYDRISAERIESDYLSRKDDNDLIRSNQKDLARRKNELDGFF